MSQQLNNGQCPKHEHLSRRAVLKGALATTAGAAVANWGGL
ncbi:MAG: twin-arginine translocation signal domain-containing protein, partial [Pedosphaera sp.]|nr:twin-arginine translocation signal domain-containing protein [Pedosphaera sp.]